MDRKEENEQNSQSGYPSTGYPQNYPNMYSTNSGYQGYPSAGYPTTGYPTTGYTHTGYPPTSYPSMYQNYGSYPTSPYTTGPYPPTYPVGPYPSTSYPMGPYPPTAYPVGPYPPASYPMSGYSIGQYPHPYTPSTYSGQYGYPTGSYPLGPNGNYSMNPMTQMDSSVQETGASDNSEDIVSTNRANVGPPPGFEHMGIKQTSSDSSSLNEMAINELIANNEYEKIISSVKEQFSKLGSETVSESKSNVGSEVEKINLIPTSKSNYKTEKGSRAGMLLLESLNRKNVILSDELPQTNGKIKVINHTSIESDNSPMNLKITPKSTSSGYQSANEFYKYFSSDNSEQYNTDEDLRQNKSHRYKSYGFGRNSSSDCNWRSPQVESSTPTPNSTQRSSPNFNNSSVPPYRNKSTKPQSKVKERFIDRPINYNNQNGTDFESIGKYNSLSREARNFIKTLHNDELNKLVEEGDNFYEQKKWLSQASRHRRVIEMLIYMKEKGIIKFSEYSNITSGHYWCSHVIHYADLYCDESSIPKWPVNTIVDFCYLPEKLYKYIGLDENLNHLQTYKKTVLTNDIYADFAERCFPDEFSKYHPEKNTSEDQKKQSDNSNDLQIGDVGDLDSMGILGFMNRPNSTDDLTSVTNLTSTPNTPNTPNSVKSGLVDNYKLKSSKIKSHNSFSLLENEFDDDSDVDSDEESDAGSDLDSDTESESKVKSNNNTVGNEINLQIDIDYLSLIKTDKQSKIESDESESKSNIHLLKKLKGRFESGLGIKVEIDLDVFAEMIGYHKGLKLSDSKIMSELDEKVKQIINEHNRSTSKEKSNKQYWTNQ